MQTTVTLDDKLLADARRVTGILETSDLLREALTRMIQDEAAQGLIRLGGSDPNATAAPRRRWKLDSSGLENT